MRILVVLTGGTIGSIVEGTTIDVREASAYNLINLYEEKYGTDIDFDIIKPYNILSENLEPGCWVKLCKCIDETDVSKYDGIIITHGSDTLAYTSALLGYCYHQMEIPMILVAANYALEDARSNGLINFYHAVCLIREKKVKGVFTVYQNDKKENIVYLATRIKEADTFADRFSVYGYVDFGKMVDGKLVLNQHPQNPTPDELQHSTDRKRITLKEYKKKILMIRPYPGLNYDSIALSEEIGAVLHCLYHSATASSLPGNTSAVRFMESCKEKEIPVYLASFKKTAEKLYATSKELLKTGAIPLVNISEEAAYTKLVLAYNQQETEPVKFMNENIYHEMLLR